MLPIQLRVFAAALAILPLAHSAACADYMSNTYQQDHAFGGFGAVTAQVETYDGTGTPGGGLSAGQARITVRGSPGAGQPFPGEPGTILKYSGIDIVFLTDLNLQPSQITAPTNWSFGAGPVGRGRGLYQVSVSNSADVMAYTDVSLLISGLGANAIESHFLLGRSYEDWGMDVNFVYAVPIDNPEPSTIVLGALALTALLGRRILRCATASP